MGMGSSSSTYSLGKELKKLMNFLNFDSILLGENSGDRGARRASPVKKLERVRSSALSKTRDSSRVPLDFEIQKNLFTCEHNYQNQRKLNSRAYSELSDIHFLQRLDFDSQKYPSLRPKDSYDSKQIQKIPTFTKKKQLIFGRTIHGNNELEKKKEHRKV